MEHALYDKPMFREFTGLDVEEDHLLDESTIPPFRRLLEANDPIWQILAIVNATLSTVADINLIAAPSFTKNSRGTRAPEMYRTNKGKPRNRGMKTHIGADANSCLVHSVSTKAANAHDITQAHALMHDEETDVFADSGYRGVER